jgi:carboxymethylenebutenolidase
MCVETPGVPPLVAAELRGANDRIDPKELTLFARTSAGWVSKPPRTDADGRTPIVIVCHERYGVVRHTIELADKFAAMGFMVVAPDFYADMTFTGEEERLPDVADDVVLRHLDAAIAHARGLEGCGADSPLAVIGICRSGSYGIVADAERSDLDAVVMLYGGAQPKEYEAGELRSTPYQKMIATGTSPVLGLWGEKDHTMSVEHVRRVRDMLEDARRSYEFVLYPDLPHGWLNDTMPGRFREAEAQETFDTIVNWLREKFAGTTPAGQVSWSYRSTISEIYDFSTNRRLH